MQSVRIVFSKTGRAVYISHLDLNRTMSRAVRRAGIPLWYTEGFNRHPYVTFAAPLSLGYEGLRECMDIRLEEDMPMDELTRRLRTAMPEGLTVQSAAPAVRKLGELAAARYRLLLDTGIETVRALLAEPSILVEKRTKKKTMKTVDIRPAISEVSLCERGEGSILELTLPCSSADTVNPSLVAEGLRRWEKRDSLPFSVTRLELLDTEGKPFR